MKAPWQRRIGIAFVVLGAVLFIATAIRVVQLVFRPALSVWIDMAVAVVFALIGAFHIHLAREQEFTDDLREQARRDEDGG